MEETTDVTFVPDATAPPPPTVGNAKTTTVPAPDDYIGRDTGALECHEIKWMLHKIGNDPGAVTATLAVKQEFVLPADWQGGRHYTVRELVAREPSVADALGKYERWRVRDFAIHFEPAQNWLGTQGLLALGYTMDPANVQNFTEPKDLVRVGDYSHVRPIDDFTFRPAITSNFMFCKVVTGDPDMTRFEDVGYIMMKSRGDVHGFTQMAITITANVDFTHPTIITDDQINPIVFTNPELIGVGQVEITSGAARFRSECAFEPEITDNTYVVACSAGVHELEVTLDSGELVYQTFNTIMLERQGDYYYVEIAFPNILPYSSTGPPNITEAKFTTLREAPFIAATVTEEI